jgi:HK97 family phage portal protein
MVEKACAQGAGSSEFRRGKGDTWAGRDVGPDGAMQLSTYWSCVRLHGETVGTLPLGVYEKAKDGSKQPVSHWLADLLQDSPNSEQTAPEFLEGQIVNMCIHGNAYALKDKRDDKSIVSLTPLSAAPGDMDRKRDAQGTLRYSFTHRGRRYIGLTEDDIFHVRGFGDDGNGGGLSVVQYARQSLAIAEGVEASSGATFRNGMKSSIFFTAPPGVKMTDPQRKDFREAFIDPYVGGEATNAGLLEQGFDVKAVSLPPKDAELLLTRRFSVEDICRWLRTPPVLIGHSADGQTMWGSGVEQIMLGWLTLGLRPYLTRYEKSIKKRLLRPADRARGIFAEFNVEGLLRADSAGRAALMSSLVQNGLMTRNEGRALDNRRPMDGGDVLTVQSALVPLDMLHMIGASAGAGGSEQARNALRAWLAEQNGSQQQQQGSTNAQN